MSRPTYRFKFKSNLLVLIAKIRTLEDSAQNHVYNECESINRFRFEAQLCTIKTHRAFGLR